MNTENAELLAMELWQKETGKTFGWGSVPETYEYRKKAKEILNKNTK